VDARGSAGDDVDAELRRMLGEAEDS